MLRLKVLIELLIFLPDYLLSSLKMSCIFPVPPADLLSSRKTLCMWLLPALALLPPPVAEMAAGARLSSLKTRLPDGKI